MSIYGNYTDWAYGQVAKAPSWYQNVTGTLSGMAGSAVNKVGSALGNPLQEHGISENLQRLGGMLVSPVSAADRPPGATPPPGGTPPPTGAPKPTVLGAQAPQQQPDVFNQMAGQAKSQAEIDLENELNQFDYYSQQAQSQMGYLGEQKTSAENKLSSAFKQSQQQAATSGTEAETSTAKAKAKGLSTAQDVQRQNRNVLRALGILSSSAAGEMLNKPMGEYQTQAADLEQGLIQRKNVIQDWLAQRTQEHQQAMTDLQNQYGQLIGNIQNDLRFNDKQRITAVKAANNALQTRLSEINASALQYQQAAQQYNANILGQIAQLRLYQNPNADVSGILSSMINVNQTPYSGGQASIYQGQDLTKKKTLSGQ